LIRYQENIFYETNGFLADSTLFDVFTYDRKKKKKIRKKALRYGKANSVCFSEQLATTFWKEPARTKSFSISQGGRPPRIQSHVVS